MLHVWPLLLRYTFYSVASGLFRLALRWMFLCYMHEHCYWDTRFTHWFPVCFVWQYGECFYVTCLTTVIEIHVLLTGFRFVLFGITVNVSMLHVWPLLLRYTFYSLVSGLFCLAVRWMFLCYMSDLCYWDIRFTQWFPVCFVLAWRWMFLCYMPDLCYWDTRFTHWFPVCFVLALRWMFLCYMPDLCYWDARFTQWFPVSMLHVWPLLLRCHYTKSNHIDDHSNISSKTLQKQNFKPLGHYTCMQCGTSHLQKVQENILSHIILATYRKFTVATVRFTQNVSCNIFTHPIYQ